MTPPLAPRVRRSTRNKKKTPTTLFVLFFLLLVVDELLLCPCAGFALLRVPAPIRALFVGRRKDRSHVASCCRALTPQKEEEEQNPPPGYSSSPEVYIDDQTSSSLSSSSTSAAASPLDNKLSDDVLIEVAEESSSSSSSSSSITPSTMRPSREPRRKMDLMWCTSEYCKDAAREKVVGDHNQILLNGPATGQVVYNWSTPYDYNEQRPRNGPYLLSNGDPSVDSTVSPRSQYSNSVPSVYLLVKQGDDRLMKIAADAVRALTSSSKKQVHILLDPSTAARLKYYHGVDGDNIHLFEVKPTPGFGSNLRLQQGRVTGTATANNDDDDHDDEEEDLFLDEQPWLVDLETVPPPLPVASVESSPDLICTLGGDGLLMHAGMMFQGPVPPILCVAGGSLGFLTPFNADEMVQAIFIALGMEEEEEESIIDSENDGNDFNTNGSKKDKEIDVFPPNMSSYPYEPLMPNKKSSKQQKQKFSMGLGDRICLSIRMRLDCRIVNHEGAIRARYNVLNEVVIDRGSSPYLAALECFCDDVHLTTVQADGVIFATPTGSTAYSLAAGSSVVHPAVPCILVTPICPHVLSFRSMVFPDHVVLRCFVPDDARAEASVAFDGKHRQELHRGDSVQIQMSAYPVPTINRKDHSSDWLGSLKRNFNFNSRARQRPL